MASTTIKIKVIGVGKSKFGLWLLGKVAKIYDINLEVRTESRPTAGEADSAGSRAHDGGCQCDCPVCQDCEMVG